MLETGIYVLRTHHILGLLTLSSLQQKLTGLNYLSGWNWEGHRLDALFCEQRGAHTETSGAVGDHIEESGGADFGQRYSSSTPGL